MKNLKPALAGAVMVVMVAGAAAQTVYRIVGPDGKVTFSDKPPVTPANTTARSTSGRAAEPNPAVGNLPYELRQVLARYPVTLYSGVGCAPCNSGRLMLQGRGIPYTEYTVASNDDIDALQRLSGDGLAFVHAGGTIIKRELRDRETLRIDTGCLVAMSPTIDYDIQFVGGFKNALFGGEGLFLASLTGPGTVYLQSLPLSRLADRIVSSSRTNREESHGLGGIGGNILGGLLGGDRKF